MFSLLKKLLGTPVPGVSPLEAQRLAAQGAVILDVREPSERARAAIPGSLHVPLGDLPGSEIPAGRVVICQCASGRRSAQAARQLRDRGVDVRNLTGGLLAWEAAGLPTRPGRR